MVTHGLADHPLIHSWSPTDLLTILFFSPQVIYFSKWGDPPVAGAASREELLKRVGSRTWQQALLERHGSRYESILKNKSSSCSGVSTPIGSNRKIFPMGGEDWHAGEEAGEQSSKEDAMRSRSSAATSPRGSSARGRGTSPTRRTGKGSSSGGVGGRANHGRETVRSRLEVALPTPRRPRAET